MNRKQRIESGDLLEIDAVLNHSPALRGMVVDSCCLDDRVWERMKESPGMSEYYEVVRLVSKYRGIAQTAPEGATSVVFEHFGQAMNIDGKPIDTDQKKWLCKAEVSVEDGLRCLTFTEEGVSNG